MHKKYVITLNKFVQKTRNVSRGFHILRDLRRVYIYLHSSTNTFINDKVEFRVLGIYNLALDIKLVL